MRKYKNGAILILTAVIIVLCGMLPVIAAMVQDSLADENVSYEKMKTVQFLEEISVVEKLFLLREGNVAEVSEEKTKIDTRNIREVAEQALLPYVEAGLIQTDLIDFSMQYEPLLYYDSESSEVSNIFWSIDMEYTGNISMPQSIYLCIDDQTGKIMVISYDCAEGVYDEDILKEFVIWFSDTYYNELSLWEDDMMISNQEVVDTDGEIFRNLEENNVQSLGEMYGIDTKWIDTGDVMSTITFYLNDEMYGELGMSFCVHSCGFYNSSE